MWAALLRSPFFIAEAHLVSAFLFFSQFWYGAAMISKFPISTDRLIVRRFRADDAAAFHGWRNDAEVARYTLWDFPYPMAEAEAFCREQAAFEAFPIGGWCQIMIEEKASGLAIGDIGLGLRLEDKDSLTVGYSLHRPYWGQGLMFEALKAILPVVAAEIDAVILKAEIDIRNAASGRVLEKLGFNRGPLKEKASFVKDEWCDEYDYHLKVDQWSL